ncbi:MAG TPA: hypothetical protein VL025_03635 [Thermoanaerobaculia bacterium]|nr:hypothetical protein [Thermoanaerobaculia bacterium]
MKSSSGIAGLAVVVFAAAALLSAKAGYDLLLSRDEFPAWFVPAFVAGLAGLVAWAGWTVAGIWKARRSARPEGGRRGVAVWLLLVLSFVCTSSVHQFHPFRLAPLAVYDSLDPVLRWNLLVTLGGFLAAGALAVLYNAAGRRGAALAGLLVLDLLLLVPNDACPNPFNTWWLAAVGASPLMFVPNLYASLFGAGALLGVRPRWNLLALVGACAGVTLLGLGHMTRVIW